MGSKPKHELIEECTRMGLSTDGTVPQLAQRIKDFKSTSRGGMNVEIEFTSHGDPASPPAPSPKLKNFFVQLHVQNFQYYLNYGLILPVNLIQSQIYRTENRKADILSTYRDHIILSNKPVSHWDDEDVMVEIFTDGLSVETVAEGIYFCCDPIPVSRIVNAIFPSEESRQRFIAMTKSSPDFYFPDRLCLVSKKTEVLDFDLLTTLPANPALTDWQTTIDVFDHVLGMFSFLRNVGIMYADKDHLFQQLAAGFFSAMSRIMPVDLPTSERDSPIFKYLLYPSEIEGSALHKLLMSRILDAIYSNRIFSRDLARNLIADVMSTGLSREDHGELEYMLRIMQSLERQQATFRDCVTADLFRKHYPLLSLLFLTQFPNKAKSHTDKQAVRNLFYSNTALISKGQAEFLTAILGLYYGYGNLIKCDNNVRIEDPLFRSLAATEQSIKIKDFSLLERVLVEQCFQFSKTRRKSERTVGLQGFPVSGDRKREVNLVMGMADYIDHSFDQWGTRVTVVEKRNRFNEVLELLDKAYGGIIPYDSLLLHYVLHRIKIPKSFLQTLMPQFQSSLNPEEMKTIIEMDGAKSKQS